MAICVKAIAAPSQPTIDPPRVAAPVAFPCGRERPFHVFARYALTDARQHGTQCGVLAGAALALFEDGDTRARQIGQVSTRWYPEDRFFAPCGAASA